MKLSDAVSACLIEARFFDPMPIYEAAAAPKWDFEYSNFHTDPHPNILLLGSYRHPNTGNNLLGGINLNYLDHNQINSLRRALPQIMSGSNLKQRYHLGKRLVPDVFQPFYRTYNAKYVHGVDQDAMYPKYGIAKTAANWVQQKLGGLFKSPVQRKQEAEPTYPSDLTNMQQQLNQTMQQLRQMPTTPELEKTPEMQAARQAYFKQQQQQADPAGDVERLEDEPFLQAQQDYRQGQYAQQTPIVPPAQQPRVQPQPQQKPQQKPMNLAAAFERDRFKTQQELTDPNNDLNLESITFYSPVQKRYITEFL